MKFTNKQFGEMEFDQKHVVEFPEGIPGFEQYRNYLIVDDEDSQPFRWLVSLEIPDLSFAMIDPASIIDSYCSGMFDNPDVIVFLLVALKTPLKASTANLRSPIVIDNATHTARQMILDDESLSVQYPLFTRQVEMVEG